MRSALAALLLAATSSLAFAQSCPPLSSTPILDPAGAAPSGMTRQQFFNYLVGVWFKPGYHVLQTVSCPTGTCLWVPWFASSNECTYDKLHTNCGLTPDGSFNISCLASDEFSQVGVALAMNGRQTDFANWVNTVRFLIGGSGSVGLPSWLAGRNGSTFTIADPSDASDATARIIIALYVAANSDLFTDPAAKASYRTLADDLSRAFIANDFATHAYTANDTAITHWLGGGYATARGNSNLNGMESWAGYYGDAVIALLAAYQSTADPLFLSYAADTINSYLLAANYNGRSFSVPPEHFQWNVNPDGSVSVTSFSGWGYFDAPRAVTLCKAPYLASLNDVDLGPRLTSYCTQWLQSGGVKRDGYKPNYTTDGKPVGTVQGGYYENGLGAAVNFALEAAYLAPKLDEALGHFATATDSFDYTACMGVYNPAFLIVNLGSAIGLDAKAFTRRSCDGGADTAAPFLSFRDSCGYVLDPFTFAVTLNGTASDDARVTRVTYSLAGTTTGSGNATGTTSWSIGPLFFNGGATSVHATAEDASGHVASVDCPVVINVFAPGTRRRSVGGHR